MLCVAAFMRPRVPRMPEGTVLEPDETPILHALASDVASALERPAPDAIVADTRWNASWALAGWRRRRVPRWAYRYWRRSSRRSGWR